MKKGCQFTAKKVVLSLVIAAAFVVPFATTVEACTSILYTDKDGNGYHGRTLEFSTPIPSWATYFPAGSKIVSSTPSGKDGLTFNTKYAILAMTAPLDPKAKQAGIAEGMNDHGLSISMQWFNGTSSPAVGNDNSIILASTDLGAWVLGNFKSAAEVKAAINSGSTEFWVPVASYIDPDAPMPQHFAVHDRSGNAIVIEFSNGKANVYDNPVGALTNDPPFPWHLENLNNYTFTNRDKNTGKLGKLTLNSTDGGNALTGLPSAETSPGRFVKAAFYNNYVRKAKTPDEAIITLAHIMNNFDRPIDLTVDGAGGKGDGVRGNSFSSEATVWTVLNDLTRNKFYYRGINAMNWVVIDMNQLKDVKQVKSVSWTDIQNSGADSTNLFLK